MIFYFFSVLWNKIQKIFCELELIKFYIYFIELFSSILFLIIDYFIHISNFFNLKNKKIINHTFILLCYYLKYNFFIMSFKVENELLGRIKEVEKTLNFNFEKSLLAVNNKIKELITKVDSMSEKVETLDKNFNEIKVKGDKIDEFIVFKNKSLDQLTSHEIRINQLIADTSFMKTKYDKMFIDNFTVPGFVGEFCKYKTIRDYIESNIKEMSLINSFKEQSLVDIKNYGSKIENLIKQFTGSLDNFSDRQKETLNNAKREIYKKVNDEINKIDNKFEDVKIYNTNEAKKLSEKTDDLIKVTKETIDFRDRLKNYFEQNLDEITSDFDEIRLNVSDLNDEYNTVKDKFQEIIAFVREFNQRKYTNKKEEPTKKLRSFQRQKTVNLKNRKVDFIANDINIEKNEDKKSTKNLTIVVEKLEKETPLKKKKVGINQKIEIHETIEKPIEEKIKEEREKNIEIEKASENNIFKKEDDEEEEEEIIKEPEIKIESIIKKEKEKEIIREKEEIKEKEKIKEEKKIKKEKIKEEEKIKKEKIKEDEKIKKEKIKEEEKINKEKIKEEEKINKEKIKERKIESIIKRGNEKENKTIEKTVERETQVPDRFLTEPNKEFSSDEEDYSPIILPKYLSKKKITIRKKKEHLLQQENNTVNVERKHNSEISPLNSIINNKKNIIEFEKGSYDSERELSKKEFEELQLKKHIVNLRLKGKGDKTFGTTVFKDFNKYMSKTNSYFYKNNNNELPIKKKRDSIDCGKMKLKKRKKVIHVSDIFNNKANIINRKIEEIYELFEKNKY